MKYADIMRMYKNKYMGAWDLIDDEGKYLQVTLIIERVVLEELMNEGRKEQKPILYMKHKNGRPFHVPAVLTRRNAKNFATTLAPGAHWEGSEITFFVEDRTNFGIVMPTLSVRGKGRGERLRESLQKRSGAPSDGSVAPPIDDGDAAKQRRAEREPGSDDA